MYVRHINANILYHSDFIFNARLTKNETGSIVLDLSCHLHGANSDLNTIIISVIGKIYTKNFF